MKRRLALVGCSAISNVVDITNYFLKELGQPMHAFDFSYLEGGEIHVRRAEQGEKIVTLDEKEFALTTENLVICDGKKPVALAGIMGGLNSEILDSTSAVMFEAAKFAHDNIRKSSKALGQVSDSSMRFSKGVDEYTTVMAMKRALHLIEELNCGKVSATKFDINTGNSVEPKKMTCEKRFPRRKRTRSKNTVSSLLMERKRMVLPRKPRRQFSQSGNSLRIMASIRATRRTMAFSLFKPAI